MKSYCDLNQCKVLMEFLPLESADMWYWEFPTAPTYNSYGYPMFHKGEGIRNVPCWSLVALLDILPYPQLSKDKLGSGKEGWMVSAYPDNCRYDSCWYDNPIDACVDMIIKSHNNNLL